MLSSGKRGFEERLRFFYVPQDTQTLKKGDKLLQNRVFAQKKTLVVDCLWDNTRTRGEEFHVLTEAAVRR